MYSENHPDSRKHGDVDVPLSRWHLTTFFHLVLPTHDFIASAVSNNCFERGRRVENALFCLRAIPACGTIDAMDRFHVSANPQQAGRMEDVL